MILIRKQKKLRKQKIRMVMKVMAMMNDRYNNYLNIYVFSFEPHRDNVVLAFIL